MRRLPILLIAATLFIFVSCSRPEAPAGAAKLQGRDGSEVTVGPEAGKVTLVHFWATWCGPCRMELPGFVEFAKANEGDKLRWVAIANDPTFAIVDEHLSAGGIKMETLLDPHGSALRTWQINSIPTTIVLDGSGNELARYIGARDWSNPKQRDEILAFAR